MSDIRKSKRKKATESRRKRKSTQSSTQNDDIISWDEYFMGIAFLSAKRSKYEVRKVGACIVNDENRIVSTGYNGYVDPLKNDEEQTTSNVKIRRTSKIHGKKNNDDIFEGEEKRLSVCHAEMNAVINRHGTSLKGCTAYVTFFPCNECAKLLAQSRISKVIYYANDKADSEKYTISRKILDFAGIPYRSYIEEGKDPALGRNEITLKFEEIAFPKSPKKRKERPKLN
ncbi:deoxycytidylate deaminase-like [Saccostrea cucullata]|uniref:deoxycytidylate deaminase-like n=1 Tax=Saccostrea cuccullata TaxID=36930 RepID=UPI002ED1D504